MKNLPETIGNTASPDGANHCLCVDIGGFAVKYGVMTENGDLLLRSEFKSDNRTLDTFIESLYLTLSPLIAHYRIQGLAVSVCGPVEQASGVVEGASALHFLHGPPLRALLTARFGLECEIENDACCAALAEMWQGAALESSDCCLVVLGTGVGGAVVKRGELERGSHRFAGEFGLMIAKFEQGAPVIMSDIASTRGLVESAERVLGRAKGTLSGTEVFALAAEDPRVAAVIEQWYRYVAMLLLNIQHALDPEMIVIGGGVSARPELVGRLQQAVAKMVASHASFTVIPHITVCCAGNDANLIGALAFFLQQRRSLVY
uniref:ROK family protein n=1 Tax=Thaumasiovibrio occultus TaxID=1891184 RepID=UPI000B3595A7|nr:ROK family protein [Thaumasiovibrio occultus]